jgi:hypothetical protein
VKGSDILRSGVQVEEQASGERPLPRTVTHGRSSLRLGKGLQALRFGELTTSILFFSQFCIDIG